MAAVCVHAPRAYRTKKKKKKKNLNGARCSRAAAHSDRMQFKLVDSLLLLATISRARCQRQKGALFPLFADPTLLRAAVQKSLLNYRSVPRESDAAAHCFGTVPCPSEEEKRESCPFFCSSPPRLTLCPPREWYFQFDRVQLRHPRGKVISLAIAETRTDEPPTMQEQKRYRCFLSLSPSSLPPLFVLYSETNG